MGRLTAIRDIVGLVVKYPPLVTFITTDSRFQDWSKERAQLGDMKDNFGLGIRCQLVTNASQKNYYYSNTAAFFRRSYMLELFTAKLDLDLLETLEEYIENAGAFIMAGKSPVDGTLLTYPAGVRPIGLFVETSDPDREPTEDEDSEEWIQALTISVAYTVDHATMMVFS